MPFQGGIAHLDADAMIEQLADQLLVRITLELILVNTVGFVLEYPLRGASMQDNTHMQLFLRNPE